MATSNATGNVDSAINSQNASQQMTQDQDSINSLTSNSSTYSNEQSLMQLQQQMYNYAQLVETQSNLMKSLFDMQQNITRNITV